MSTTTKTKFKDLADGTIFHVYDVHADKIKAFKGGGRAFICFDIPDDTEVPESDIVEIEDNEVPDGEG